MARTFGDKLARVGAVAAVLAALALLPGCFLVAAGAGAGGAVYVTTRGAESLVNADVEEVASAVEDTFDEMGIRQTGAETEQGGEDREIRGETDDLDVTVSFQRESANTTKVEVTARDNVAEWDKDYAKEVLEGIVERT